MRTTFLLAAAVILMTPVQAQTPQAQTPPVPAQAAPVQAQTPPPAETPGPTTRPIHTAYVDTGKTCDGWPLAAIGMAPGFCAGIVIAPPADFNARILKMPRVPLVLPGGKDVLVTDLVQWGSSGGQVLRITAEPGKPPIIKPILTHLYMPHTVMRGPDGKIYVNEISRIFRFDPDAADPQASIETVIADLPDTRVRFNLHPLSSFMFDANRDLLIAVGAPSDRCTTKDGKPDGTEFCLQSEGADADKTAVVRRYTYIGGGRWSPKFKIMAQGLRNSVAMALHKSGTLLQGENSVDFPQADSPFEEFNVLRQGAHYGWPYCYDMNGAVPLWADAHIMDCDSRKHTKPVRLLPPHGSPLSMLYYNGAMFPELRGKLVLSLHGYRPGGARLVAFEVDRHGVPVLTPDAHYDAYAARNGDETVSLPYPGPASEPLVITPGWNTVVGAHPMGSPLGLSVAEDGAIWVVEDRNGTLLRIARDKP
jgi:glucose/arabinose dehydrogenase